MHSRIERYLEEKGSPSSVTSLSVLKQYRSRNAQQDPSPTIVSLSSTSVVSPRVTTTHRVQMNVDIDPRLDQALHEIEHSCEESLNEMNGLFNEVDSRRKRREIPEYLTCKLCYDLMRDPVITPCKFTSDCMPEFSLIRLVGITYCRACIEENLYKVSHLDPIANKPLAVEQLVTNLVLKEIIEKFVKDNEWVNSECF